jgi:hypothetical protein
MPKMAHPGRNAWVGLSSSDALPSHLHSWPSNVSCRTSCTRGSESLQPTSGPHLFALQMQCRGKLSRKSAPAILFVKQEAQCRLKFLRKTDAWHRSTINSPPFARCARRGFQVPFLPLAPSIGKSDNPLDEGAADSHGATELRHPSRSAQAIFLCNRKIHKSIPNAIFLVFGKATLSKRKPLPQNQRKRSAIPC